MSLSSDSVLNRDNLNRAYVSKSATGTQIMAGSLRLLGGVTIDGVTTLGALTVGAINAGANAITTTGTVTAGTFSGAHSGVGTLLTALNATNIASGTIADARLSTNVVMLNKAQTFTANNTYSAAANLYFAGGTTYKIDTAGSASFNALSVAGNVTLDGNDYITFGSAGLSAPANSSAGTKIKLYGESYQIGVNSSVLWYDSNSIHSFYTNNGTTTRTLRAEITDVDTHIFTDLNVDKNLEVAGEFKAGFANEFPDPLLVSKSTALWNAASNGTLALDIQTPTATGAVSSIKITASAADAFSYSTALFDTNPNEWITYSLYNFCTTASKSGDLYIQWLDASQVHISFSGVTFIASTGWTRQRLTAQAPATARYFKIRIGNNGGTGAVMYYAAFQVERGKALTGFKSYTGGAAASFFDKGIVISSGGEIHSGYNNAYILKDFGNSNVTLSAAGGTLHLGYNNTSKVILSTALYGVNTTTQIAGTDGTLYYQGVNIDTRYVTKSADSVVTSKIRMEGIGAQLFVANQFSIGSNPSIDLAIGDADTGFNWVSDGKLDFVADSTVVASMGKALLFDFKVAPTLNGTKIWHAGNDGAGSGLDADLFDGLDSGQFVRSDASGVIAGNKEFYSTDITGNYANSAIEIREVNNVTTAQSTAAYAPALALHWGGRNQGQLALESNGVFTLRDGVSHAVNKTLNAGGLQIGGVSVWHPGNDGAGSGLDADKLDGKDSTDFMDILSATAIDVDTVTGNHIYTGSSGAWLNRAPSGNNATAMISINTHSGTYYSQLWFDTEGDNFYHRSINSTAKRPWAKVWTSTNDGAGSALDADLLDGLQGSSYLRSNVSDTFTGTLTLAGSQTISGTLGVAGNLNTDGDLSFSRLAFLKGIAGAHREGGNVNLLSRLSGRIANRNPDFINGSTAGQDFYDNNGSGRLIRSMVSDDLIPNSTGKLLRYDYDPARNATTSTSPGFGGFTLQLPRKTGVLDSWGYRAGNRYIFRLIAKIPIGRNIEFTSNLTGNEGGGEWLTSVGGTGDWQEYVYMYTIGITGTFGDTGYYYISGGTDTAFTWDVASVHVIGIDEVPDVDRAPTLNVGYKSGVDVGWGEIYSTGKITSDSNIESTNGDFITKNNSLLGLRNAANTSWIDPQDTSGQMWLKNSTTGKGIYLDSDLTYIRNAAGTNQITVAANGDTTIVNNLTVSKAITTTGITVAKTGNISTISFPAGSGGNDAGYIKHYETTSNVGIMQFSASDDAADTDYFSFGATPSSVYTEGARITTTGNATFKATTVTSLTSSGNVTVNGDLSISTTASDKAALSIGAVTIGQVAANGTHLVMSNLSELRFGTATNATWDYNKWGGIKYITTSDAMIIGGPASPNFAANTSPPRISLNFEGIAQANLDGKMVINPTTVSTIGGVTLANGYLLLGSITDGLALDPNEIYGATYLNIGTVGSGAIKLMPNNAVVLTADAGSVAIAGVLSTTGLTTSTGGFNAPSGKSLYIGANDSTSSIRVHYNGTDSFIDYGGIFNLRSGTTSRVTVSALGNMGIKVAPHVTYGINTDSVVVSNWFRSTGDTGWINETHGGGITMSDTTWVRVYGGKSFYQASGTMRVDGTLQIGAASQLTVNATTFNWLNTIYSSVGKVSINQASATSHPLHVKSDMSYEGINIQSTADANISGLSMQNSSGSYTWHMAKSSTASADLIFFSGLGTLSTLSEKFRIKNAGGIDIKGTIEYDDVSRYWLSTATNWGLYWNTTLNAIEFHGGATSRFSVDLDNGNTAVGGTLDVAATLNVVGTATADNYNVTAGNGEGVRFWASSAYSIYMSTTADGTYGGSVPSAPVGDYNMYFKMTTAGRGFVFKTNSGSVAQIEESGKVHAEGGFRTKKYEMVYNATEDSLDFVYTG